ncbi:metallophosphoesterase [Alkalihalobacillus sp. BA299]|uniref:metallophosphoesterase n=1 Tax=Alkalihalobacillus sp. BA299 TaxID=2815938 RepID=UPI001ADA5389|nr:metallophosphoesterase [Alkalihalobacillus sp. BA299]
MIVIFTFICSFAILFGTILLIYMYKEAFGNHVIETELAFTNFPLSFDGMRIFFISDIHFRIIDERIIERVSGKVDLVIVGGDIMEKNVPFSNVEKNISLLQRLGPVHFVWGNNDYEGDFRKLDATLLEKGVQILDNTAITYENGGEKVILLGVDDVGCDRDQLDLALHDSDEGFRLLISHNPSIVEKVSIEHNISLVLSGHTHGGQIRIFGFSLGERGGLKRHNNTLLFISNGYGTTSLPLRLGAPAETHLITLRTSKNDCV